MLLNKIKLKKKEKRQNVPITNEKEAITTDLRVLKDNKGLL